MHQRMMNLVVACALGLALAAPDAHAGSIFLTGHDPDFHALLGGNALGAQHINQKAIGFVMDPTFNTFVAGGATKFLFVESSIAVPAGHVDGLGGLTASGYVQGTNFVKADASTLNAALNQLGTLYGGIVIGSDFGGILTQAELNILNARSADIISFLNAGGGLYAMAEGSSGANLTPGGGWFGFLPFIVTSAALNQSESGFSVTAYGTSLGLTASDINGNASHNIFTGTGGMTAVDRDAQGDIMSLATRSQVTSGGVVPEPSSLILLGTGLVGAARRWRKRRA